MPLFNIGMTMLIVQYISYVLYMYITYVFPKWKKRPGTWSTWSKVMGYSEGDIDKMKQMTICECKLSRLN
jgi:hypothetical protein